MKIEDFKKAIEIAREKHIKPDVVKDSDQAKEMTNNDILGREWKVGDEYYIAVAKL